WSWRGRELRGVGNANRNSNFSVAMQERNFVREEKFGRRSRRQNKDREGHHSAHHLSERRCRFFRLPGLSWNDCRQRNSQFAADGLAPFDFGQAIAHLLLERD